MCVYMCVLFVCVCLCVFVRVCVCVCVLTIYSTEFMNMKLQCQKRIKALERYIQV